jgi:hypothetical protein
MPSSVGEGAVGIGRSAGMAKSGPGLEVERLSSDGACPGAVSDVGIREAVPVEIGSGLRMYQTATPRSSSSAPKTSFERLLLRMVIVS